MEDAYDFTTLEVLGIAIKSEIDAVRLYTRMKEKVEGEDLKEKMDFLISQEKKHETMLKSVYEKKFPQVKLALPPKSVVPMIDEVLGKDSNLKELFDAGMKAERLAEVFYSDLAGKTHDARAKSVLMYMANMEQSHYSILKAEWSQIERLKTGEASQYRESDGLMFFGP